MANLTRVATAAPPREPRHPTLAATTFDVGRAKAA